MGNGPTWDWPSHSLDHSPGLGWLGTTYLFFKFLKM